MLKALLNKGIPRLKAYRAVQKVAFLAHDKEMDFIDAVKNDRFISSSLNKREIESIFVPENHFGASLMIINNVNKTVAKTVKKFI